MASTRNLTLPAAMVLALFSAGTLLSACEEQGPAERAGEKIDEGAKDTKRAIQDATD